MYGDFEIREMPLSLKSVCDRVKEFLQTQNLRMSSLDRYFGVFRDDDILVGGGGLHGDIIKCMALTEETRGLGITNSLVSRIQQEASADGINRLSLFTKPENETLFRSLGFRLVGKAPEAILMESDSRGISGYCESLRSLSSHYPEEQRGVIVMNCNPLTSGHLYLIKKAAAMVGRLFIIPVNEDNQEFSFSERYGMLSRAVEPMENVTLCPGSRYAVSKDTFPTYFLKNLDDASATYMALDLDIFGRHIAKALGATMRFVGSEPHDSLTAAYNESMKKILPDYGIKVKEISRLEAGGTPVSASSVRRLLEEEKTGSALSLVASASRSYVISHEICRALRKELDLTPKPGLVDLADNGSHKDMDRAMMLRSIEALHPFFTKLALLGESSQTPEHQEIVSIGLEAEKEMNIATDGVNTHRGALFCMGLTAIAASRCMHIYGHIEPSRLQEIIKETADPFSGEKGSHGADVRKKYDIPGASDIARGGYDLLFSDWLPFFKSVESKPESGHLLLLRIMATLPDTNLYHRGGEEGASFARETAEALLNNYSEEGMRRANEAFISRNLSPGGSADMLALTIFINSLLDR